MRESQSSDPKNKRVTSKQVVALTGVILLALMYIVTLIVAIVDRSASGKLFALCLLATFAIPILIWVYIWIYGKLTGRETIADFKRKDPGSDADA